jgi:glutaconyl-CoA/methylmalonyl-CoA decarboxylase subunit gamma
MKLRVTVNGVAYEVDVDILEDRESTPFFPAPAPAPPTPVAPVAAPPRPPAAAPAQPAAGANTLVSPIPGTVLEVLVKVGQPVKSGDPVVILDAMKMNTQVPASADGVVKEILVQSGDAVRMSQALIVFE